VLEGRFPRAVLDDLIKRGHRAEMGEEWTEGRLSGARVEPDGQMFAGANPRGMQGYAVGR
jgi:gamma-glutamyltranspeptidase/glutathione hydrolase